MKQFFLDMKISHKLVLSGLALLLPLLVVLGLLVAEKNIAINFSQKEIDGTAYLVPLRSLVENVPEHRGLSYGYLNGKAEFRAQVAKKASEIEEDIRQIDEIDQEYGEKLGTSSEWKTLKRAWSDLKSEALSLSARESFSRHNDFIGQLLGFIRHVSDASNLILDPDLDTYYLMDAVVLKLPELTERIGRLRGLGAGVAAQGEMDESQKIAFVLLEGEIEAVVNELERGMASAVAANADLKPIQAASEDAISKLHQFEKIFSENTQWGEAFDIDAQAYFNQGTEVIRSFFHVFDEAIPALSGLLKLRVDQAKSNRQNVLAGAVLFILVGLFIGVFTIRAISHPLSEMTDAVKKVAKGDFSSPIHVYGKDEAGLLAQGFLKMIEGLKEAEVQKATAARVSAMVENSEANFLLADMDFKLVYMNPASKKTFQRVSHILPCAVDEMLGKSIDLFHKNPQGIRRLISDVKNLPYSTNIVLGDEVLALTAVAIFDHNKQRIGTMANWELITEKAKIQRSLKETTVSVASASEELATASREMQANAEHTTEQAQNVATISNQTDQNVQSVAAAAEEMSVTVKEISKNVHNANQITEQAVEMAESMNETIVKLDASNSEIGNVVKVISMIAGQTNLLALNATIEAARAGDAGKGFAVVANEVKELAKGTSKATDEIRQQIVAIQSNTKGAIESIEKITEIIKENNSITTSIASAVEEQSMTTNEISLNMAEAAKETKQVVEELEEIIATSQNTASSAVNIGEASEELSRTASHLSGLTDDE